MSELRFGEAADPARPSRLSRLRARLDTGRRRVDAVKLPKDEPVLISACLAGVPCTYAAEAKTRPWALEMMTTGRAVAVCPEVAGGLPVPRPEAEIQGGDGADVLEGRARVLDVNGADVTRNYLRGAEVALDAARRSGARLAVLKARSPSCGCGAIYDGTFGGRTTEGDGVAAAALKREGLDVFTDEDVEA